MHELVRQHVGVLAVGAGEREDYAMHESFRHSAFPLGDDARDDVGLLEVDEAVVEDHFLRALDPVSEDVRVVGICGFQHSGRVHHRRGSLRVVIDLEMLCLQDGEVEGAVLHLVALEVLPPREERSQGKEDEGQKRFQGSWSSLRH